MNALTAHVICYGIDMVGGGNDNIQARKILNQDAEEMMATKSPVFDQTYQGYLSQIAEFELTDRQAILGFEIQNGQAVIPLFNKVYLVSSGGIFDSDGNTPHLSVCVILFKYLLMCPQDVPRAGDLAAYKDFKDAGPLIHFFASTVEGELVGKFSGNLSALDKACLDSGGKPYAGELAYQVKYQFHGLPRISLYLLFNDAEEGFGAQCSILFDRHTEAYLDMESVAMLGGSLSQMLINTLK